MCAGNACVLPDASMTAREMIEESRCLGRAASSFWTNLMGDAQVISKWGQQSIDANPDMMKALRRVRNPESQWRFCFPTAVDFNSKPQRLQVYRKVRDYVDFQADL